LNEYEDEIRAITLIPSDGGRFEVTVNQKIIFSKKRTGRHVAAGEVASLVREYLLEAKQ
jgi:selenoprotein W-related protein